MSQLAEYIERARGWFEDLTFGYVREWKQQEPSRRVIGFLPVYIPREIVHAAGMLPVGIFGAGDRIPVVHGDAYFQSYICHLPRTVVELAQAGHLEAFDGFIFPAICDVIRNLSGIFRLKYPGRLIRYLDFPQNFDPAVGGAFYLSELERLQFDLARLNGCRPDVDTLNKSLELYNTCRRRLTELRELRRAAPHKISTVDYYLVQRAGHLLSVEDYTVFLETTLRLVRAVTAEPEDRIRVVVTGSFCEQPPLGLIRTIENAGCYIVEDDFQLNLKWIEGEIPAHTRDPLGALVEAYLARSTFSATVYEDERSRGEALARQVREARADGVIFCAPSFCDPALLDRPLLERAMERHHIRTFSFQYHENLGQFHVIKEQAGTFADTIKLWE